MQASNIKNDDLHYMLLEIQYDYNDVPVYDNTKDVKWLLDKVHTNNANILCAVGILYEYGIDVKQNIYTAIDYYSRSAIKNNSFAIYRLVSIYDDGDSIHCNVIKKLLWINDYMNRCATSIPDTIRSDYMKSRSRSLLESKNLDFQDIYTTLSDHLVCVDDKFIDAMKYIIMNELSEYLPKVLANIVTIYSVEGILQ